jgi:hypothetical protein
MNNQKPAKPTSIKCSQNKPKQTFCSLSKTQEKPNLNLETKKQSESGPAENEGGIVCESNRENNTNCKPVANMRKQLNQNSTFKRKETHRNQQKNAARRIQAL